MDVANITTLTSRCRDCRYACDHSVTHCTILDKNMVHVWVSGEDGTPSGSWLGKHLSQTAHAEDRELAIQMTSRVIDQSRGVLFLARDQLGAWWLVDSQPAHSVGGDVGAVVVATPCCEGFFRLSISQRSVATMLSRGLSVEASAKALELSPHTVRTHLSRMIDKIGLLDVGEVVRWSIAHTRPLALYQGSQILL